MIFFLSLNSFVNEWHQLNDIKSSSQVMKLFQYLTQIQLLILGYVLSLSHCTDMLQFLSKENVYPIMLGLKMKHTRKECQSYFSLPSKG